MIGSAPEDELFDLPRGRQPGRRAPGFTREIILIMIMMMLLMMVLMRVMMIVICAEAIQPLFSFFNRSSCQYHMDVSTTSQSVSWTMTKEFTQQEI